MSYAYSNLMNPTNTAIGVGEYCLIAPVRDFAVGGIKSPAPPFTNKGDSVIIKNAHEFLAGKAFAKMALLPDKNQLDGKQQGDKGSQNFGFEISVFAGGLYAEAIEQFANIINTPLIALIPDINCGLNQFYQLGCDCSFAYANVETMTGTTVNGAKGHSMKIQWSGPNLFIYQVEGGPAILE